MKKLLIFQLLLALTINAQGLFQGEGLGIPNPLAIDSKNQNFENKHFGVEVNPFYLLVLTPGDNEERYLSGTISYFDHEKNVEIAMPLSYISLGDHDYKQYTLDLHYRKFFDDRVGGSYFSGFVRYANLNGRLWENYDNHSGYTEAKQSKVGLGAGIGYRYFANNGFYWGASLSLGAYIGNNNDLEYDTSMFFMGDDHTMIVDIEFFKFGWAF